MTPKNFLLTLALAVSASLCSVAHAGLFSAKPPIPASYNVVWDSPSPDAWESMPLSGRLGAGANVWVQDGSLWLYLAHNAAYDEDGRLLKLGCLRLTPSDGLLSAPAAFRQELDLTSGAILIDATAKDGRTLRLKLWFAGENLVIESATKSATAYTVQFGTWRDITRDGLCIDMGKRQHTLRADRVEPREQALVWFHRNADHPTSLDTELAKQPFAKGHLTNPAENNLFGGALVCDRPLAAGPVEPVQWQKWTGRAWTFTAAPAKSHTFVAALRAAQNAQPDTWLAEARALLARPVLRAAARDEQKRWDEFWSRSHIVINSTATPGTTTPSDKPWLVGRNYQLFRYMLASNRGGKLPLLFNGGIFTTDNFNKIPKAVSATVTGEINRDAGGPSTPDNRHWMFCSFMAQNQRWLGWPAILAGDTDLLEPSSALYRMHAGSAAARARGLGAEGVVYPEPLTVWGLTWWAIPTGQCGAPHLRYAFAMMLENAWMALHGHTTLGKDISADIGWIKDSVRFFDSYYRKETKRLTGSELGPDGKLRLFPANSIELLIGAENPIEVVAALRRLTDALTKLEPTLVSTAEKTYFANLLTLLPELPVGEKNGLQVLLPAKSYEKFYNKWELPELYAAWPYRLHSVTRPGTAAIAQTTWDNLPRDRADKVTRDYSWMPVVVNMAALGNTPEAARRVIDKLSNTEAPQARFPAFFGPGHDWVPDHNWGGSGMVGLQEMLLAAAPYHDGKIYLLPAWPKDWDVDFKLHAPQQTVVEARVKNGRLVSLKVTPESRRKDLVIPDTLTP
jgi:hypothetical protein